MSTTATTLHIYPTKQHARKSLKASARMIAVQSTIDGKGFAIYRLARYTKHLWVEHKKCDCLAVPYDEFFRSRQVYSAAAKQLHTLSGRTVLCGEML